MTLIEQLKKTVSEWMTKPEAAPVVEAPKDEVNVEAPVAMAAEVPAPEVDLAKRVADLGALVVALDEKLDAMSKVDHSATAMSAVAELRKEIEGTKADVTKLAAQPAGEVISPEKKTKKVAMSAVKPAVAALAARLANPTNN